MQGLIQQNLLDAPLFSFYLSSYGEDRFPSLTACALLLVSLGVVWAFGVSQTSRRALADSGDSSFVFSSLHLQSTHSV